MVWPAQFLGPLQGEQPTLPAPSRRTRRVPPQPWTLALAPVLRSSHAVHLLDSGRLLAADDPSTSPYAANALLPMSEIIIGMIQDELLPQAVLTLAECGHPSPHRGHMLAHRQVEALNERGIDLAAQGRQHGIDGLQGAKHHTMMHLRQTPAPHRLHHLRVEELRQW